MKQREPDWDAIREDYLACEISIADLVSRHGISRHHLYHQIKRNGWPRWHELARQHDDRPELQTPALAKRLATLIHCRIDQYRKTVMADPEMASNAKIETEAKALTQMVKLLESLSALQGSAGDLAGMADDQTLDNEGLDHRAALAAKLEGLLAEATADPSADHSKPE